MRNPYMKFQDDISNMNTHTHTDKPKPICPPLFQSWGHNDQLGSNTDPRYIQNRVIMNRVIKRLRCNCSESCSQYECSKIASQLAHHENEVSSREWLSLLYLLSYVTSDATLGTAYRLGICNDEF